MQSGQTWWFSVSWGQRQAKGVEKYLLVVPILKLFELKKLFN